MFFSRESVLSLLVIFNVSIAMADHAAELPKMHAPTTADSKQLKTLDMNLQNAKSVSMKFEKTFTGAVLEKTLKSSGTILLSKGRVRMETQAPNHTLMIFGNKGFWSIEYPAAEFKDAKMQVGHSANDKKAEAKLGLGAALLKGKLASYFKILNVQVGEKNKKTFFLSPSKPAGECARAEAVIANDGKELRALRYWDEQGNATEYLFSDVQSGLSVKAEDFDFSPPKNADVFSI